MNSQLTTESHAAAVNMDEHYMSIALELADKGKFSTHPNPAVGCVIVKNKEIVGSGWHQSAGEKHAEIIALEAAGRSACQATMYVTLEPCCHQGRTPPCTRAVIQSQVSRVVIACEDPNPLVNQAGIHELQDAGIKVDIHICKETAQKLNRGFFKRMARGLPFIILKMAASLDGRTAMADGESQWITSKWARQDGHRLRAGASAILTGSGTVMRDNPALTARISGLTRQPDRIVFDSELTTPPDARIFEGEGKVLLFTMNDSRVHQSRYHRQNTEIVVCSGRSGEIDLLKAVKICADKEMNTILVEAGHRLSGSLVQAGLVDEVVVYMSPDLLGGNATAMFNLPGLTHLSDRIQMEFVDAVRIGPDLKLILRPPGSGL